MSVMACGGKKTGCVVCACFSCSGHLSFSPCPFLFCRSSFSRCQHSSASPRLSSPGSLASSKSSAAASKSRKKTSPSTGPRHPLSAFGHHCGHLATSHQLPFFIIFPSFNMRGKTAGDESTQQLVHFHSQPQLLCFSHNQANLWKSNYGSLVSQDPFFRNRET